MSSSTNSIMAQVSFKNILRQAPVSADGTPDQVWSKFVDDVHRVHGIPSDASFYLTYNDEDGDLITLDTGVELGELVRQGPGRSLRFDLVLRDPIPHSVNIEVVIDRATYSSPTNTEKVSAPATTLESGNPQESASTVPDPPEPELVSKTQSSSSSSSSGSSSRPNVGPDDPLSPMIESIQPILASLANDPALLRSLLSNLGGFAAMFIQPFIERLQESILKYNTAGTTAGGSAGGQIRPGPGFRGGQHPWRGFGGGHPLAAAFGQGANPWATAMRQAQEQLFQGQQVGEDQSGLSEEEIREKMETLQGLGLGWENGDHVRELLKRYDGNVDRVAEVLLRE
ncbi:hypothetical protein BJ742DRAFT_816257 [Cladochytrium replicatum]|nr:hypothetical protein BJ742DRAFT_816257 [Cladochytrium replicatum]